MAIHFKKPLGNLGRTWQMISPFWLDIWRAEGYAHSQKRVNISFWFYFVDCVLIYRYTYVFVRLCLVVHVMHVKHVALLHVRYNSCLCSQQHPLGGTPAYSGTTSAMNNVLTVHKTILSYPQSKGNLVILGWVGAQTQFPQKTLNFNYVSLYLQIAFKLGHWVAHPFQISLAYNSKIKNGIQVILPLIIDSEQY